MEQTYKIGEAATLLNLKTYVLRFWETEFPQISPLRTEKGQRLYTEKDIELLKRIQFLLHERGLTIEGARRILAESSGALPASALSPTISGSSYDTYSAAFDESDVFDEKAADPLPFAPFSNGGSQPDTSRQSEEGLFSSLRTVEQGLFETPSSQNTEAGISPDSSRKISSVPQSSPPVSPPKTKDEKSVSVHTVNALLHETIAELEEVSRLLRGLPRNGKFLQ